MDLFQPAMQPFAVALGVVAAIAALEIVGLLFGVAFSGLVDAALPDLEIGGLDVEGLEADGFGPDGPDASIADGAPGVIGQFLSWLCVGKVPALILIAAFLTGFGVAGAVLQNLSNAAFGGPMPVGIAAAGAFIAALPITRTLGNGVARIMPKEQTDARSRDSFIGRPATIVRGVAKKGAPAEAKLKDETGATHYFLIEPDMPDQTFTAGADVLIVSRAGAHFTAIANDSFGLSDDPVR